MPKNFNTIKKYLTDEEKLIEYFEDYQIENPKFEFAYIDDPNYREPTDEELEYNEQLGKQIFNAFLNDDTDLENELREKLIDYPERTIDIEKTFNMLPNIEKEAALIYIKNNLYKEKIILKCLKCGYEEEIDYEIVEECWMDGPYPISYCPKCDKPQFVPLDIYNKKKK